MLSEAVRLFYEEAPDGTRIFRRENGRRIQVAVLFDSVVKDMLVRRGLITHDD